MYGPTGIGVLYGKRFLLEAMSPYQGGGDMILHVSFDETIYNAPPYKFEAGTPPIAAAIGLAVAVDYLTDIGLARIAEHESMVLQHASEQLGRLPGVRIIGTASEKSAVISFMVDGIHPHDVGSLLNHYGIAIRAGHHCAQPVMQHFRVPATARASFALYNTRSEVDMLVDALKNIQRLCLH
jgi:cysteine desulfurase/selenocysteine lyase